ncbi:mas-related G-protein coupled receptor member X4-like [Vombatus ursinus]|uniref:mas-related G-protein coupled receptor member X4-like n=1 Tax=Vombatus ursinus TaxID=29139 RepID=UPI000FFD60F0|nr:mas-related G-protein coupled receptor member X4-like [Vombatus ursinus]
MAASPTPEQLEYFHDNSTERSANESLVLVEPGNFYLSDWMEILSMLIAIVGLVGNSIVLWLLGFCIPRNPFSVYILNLAGADALFLCCSFLHSVHELYYFSMDKVVKYLRHMFYTMGLSLLASISTERCLAVLFPIWYRCHRPKHTSAAVCTVLWALTSLFWAIVYVLCFYRLADDFCDGLFVIQVVWFFLLAFVLCVSSLTLLLRVQCSSQRRQPPRLYLLVLLTVLVFLLFALPLGMEHIIWSLGLGFTPSWLNQLLTCVNSSANPFIYFFLGSRRHRRKKEPLRVVLQRALGDEQEVGGETRDTPHTNSPETSS